MTTQDLGAITAYAEAVAGGYTGTKAEFEALLAGIPNLATRAENPTVGHLAGLDAEGNPVDSGKIASDFAEVSDLAEHIGDTTNPHGVTAVQVGADPSGTATNAINTHNVAVNAHNDIRILINGLASRLNALADSDDTTLDQMSEIVAYIQSNRSLIESVTTNKINVLDIINNLTTNVTNKPLSAAQGVVLKGLIDSIVIPTTLPANGGNADTVDNKHAADFAAVSHTHAEYLTQHQDISGKIDKTSIQTSITDNDLKIPSSGAVVDYVTENAGKEPISLTRAEYDALTVKDPETFYIITDESTPTTAIDPIPTSGSINAVQSNGVYNALANIRVYIDTAIAAIQDGNGVSY